MCLQKYTCSGKSKPTVLACNNTNVYKLPLVIDLSENIGDKYNFWRKLSSDCISSSQETLDGRLAVFQLVYEMFSL